MRQVTRYAAALAISIVTALVLLNGCGGGGTAASGRVLLVGIDSADWNVIDPLLQEDRMPNLARLMDAGVSCDLHSLEPKQKSPTIWATIATGKFPEKHGIGGYIDPASKNLMTSNMRTARTFWEIVGDRGLTVTVVGWLVTWPAERVNGYLVSDYFRFPPKPDRPLPEHLTYPEDLATQLEPLRVVADDVTDDDLGRLVDIENAMTANEAQKLPVDQMFKEMRAINDLGNNVDALRDIVAGDLTYLGVAKRLMRDHPTDVTAVYLRGVDSASHRFWAAAHRGQVGFPVSETEERVFGGTVTSYYEYADEMLGELVDAFGDGTVIVCSDHGFEGPKPGKLPGGVNDHGPVGILVMSGPSFLKDRRIDEQSVQNITPTILELCGFAVADDMDGHVITQAFDPGFLKAHPVTRTPTYELEAH